MLIQLEPRPDESGFGYFRRLAEANGLARWRELAGEADIVRSRNVLMDSVERVAESLGIPSHWATDVSYQESQARGWLALRRTSADAVCPRCLNDEPYLRQHWEHAYSTCCATHRAILIDRCPACEQRLSPNRAEIAMCDCGQDLRTCEIKVPSHAQRWLSSLIATSGASSAGVKPTLHQPEANDVCELVRTLCLYIDPWTPPPRRASARVTTVSAAIEFLTPLEKLLQDWPANLQTHVIERIAAGPEQARTLSSSLGQWYARVKKVCHGTSLEPILKIVMTEGAKHFVGPLGLGVEADVAEDVTQHVMAADAAKELGVSRSTVHNAIKGGICAHRTRAWGTRGQAYEVSRAEVDRIAECRRGWVGEDAACELLAISPGVLQTMMAAGVVRSDPHWRRDPLKGGIVQLDSLEAFHAKLCAAASDDGATGEKVLRFSEMTRRGFGDHKALQAAMKAMESGALVALRRETHLGELRFRRRDVEAFLGSLKLQEGMSLQELAQATGWKWESIRYWIDQGLLQATETLYRGQPTRVVCPRHLVDFRSNYVPLADLARQMGTKASYLAEQLNALELIGGLPLPNGAKRGLLIRMSDLGKLALVGATATARQQGMSQ